MQAEREGGRAGEWVVRGEHKSCDEQKGDDEQPEMLVDKHGLEPLEDEVNDLWVCTKVVRTRPGQIELHPGASGVPRQASETHHADSDGHCDRILVCKIEAWQSGRTSVERFHVDGKGQVLEGRRRRRPCHGERSNLIHKNNSCYLDGVRKGVSP